jgi:hypothetical protein
MADARVRPKCRWNAWTERPLKCQPLLAERGATAPSPGHASVATRLLLPKAKVRFARRRTAWVRRRLPHTRPSPRTEPTGRGPSRAAARVGGPRQFQATNPRTHASRRVPTAGAPRTRRPHSRPQPSRRTSTAAIGGRKGQIQDREGSTRARMQPDGLRPQANRGGKGSIAGREGPIGRCTQAAELRPQAIGGREGPIGGRAQAAGLRPQAIGGRKGPIGDRTQAAGFRPQAAESRTQAKIPRTTISYSTPVRLDDGPFIAGDFPLWGRVRHRVRRFLPSPAASGRRHRDGRARATSRSSARNAHTFGATDHLDAALGHRVGAIGPRGTFVEPLHKISVCGRGPG